MSDRKEFIGVRVTADEKTQFKEHIEESNEVDSLSRFLRRSALREMKTSDEPDVVIDHEEIANTVESVLEPILARLDRIDNQLVALDSNVSNDEEIDQLAREIYVNLPAVESLDDVPPIPNDSELGAFSDGVLVNTVSTPYLWSQYFDEDLSLVRKAMARMLEYYPDVDFIEEDVGSHENVPTFSDLAGVERRPRASGEQIVRRYFKTGE